MMPGPVLRVKDYAGPVYDGVPAVGEHTEDVLAGELGMAADRLAELAGAGVISARRGA